MVERIFRAIAERFFRIHPDEVRPVLWSCAYFFFLLAAYYILRPLRETLGLEGGVRNLPWLYLGTLGTMLVANPIFAAVVSRWPRRRFVPLVYRVSAAVLLAFWFALVGAEGGTRVWLARAFFIWVSVFNMFAVSVFWAFMADLWKQEQGKRLFGLMGVGGTAGAGAGALATALLAPRMEPLHLLFGSILLLEAAVLCIGKLARIFDLRGEVPIPGRREVGGGALAGIGLVFRSPYLAGIATWIVLFTVTSTFLYFERARIVAEAIVDDGARTALFATLDFWVQALAITVQLFLTGRILSRFGVGAVLLAFPLLTAAGFAALGTAPELIVVGAFWVLRAGTNYSLAKPAREVLFTVVGRDEKYKAKSLIDTFVYRCGDAIGAWAWGAFAMTTGMVAGLVVPIALIWGAVGWKLGRGR